MKLQRLVFKMSVGASHPYLCLNLGLSLHCSMQCPVSTESQTIPVMAPPASEVFYAHAFQLSANWSELIRNLKLICLHATIISSSALSQGRWSPDIPHMLLSTSARWKRIQAASGEACVYSFGCKMVLSSSVVFHDALKMSRPQMMRMKKNPHLCQPTSGC